MKQYFFLVMLASSLTLSCSKSDQKIFSSKEDLLTSISKSNEFKKFYDLSKKQSRLLLELPTANGNNDSSTSNIEIEGLQLAKKSCIEELAKLYSKSDLQSLTKDDLRIIVKNISTERELRVTTPASIGRMSDAASCKKQYDNEVNGCFENFLIDEGACFLQGLWGVVTGCHIDSVKDHLKCNRAADKHFKECK